MKLKQNRSKLYFSPFDIIIWFVMAVVVIICVFPIYYIIILSFSDPLAVSGGNVTLLPNGFQVESYKQVMQNPQLWRTYFNTIVYVSGTTVLMIITCVLGAYPLSVPNLMGRKAYVIFLIIPMYFSGGLIPTYLLMTSLGLYNNIWAIIIPGCFSIWNIMLTNTYFRSIDSGIREAAVIDGASHFKILYKIYVPLAVPIIAVISIYTIVAVWNNWFQPMVYLTDSTLHPLQLFLRGVLIEQNIDLGSMNQQEIENIAKMNMEKLQLRYATIVISTLPILCTYPFFQKYFIKGIMVGSLKG